MGLEGEYDVGVGEGQGHAITTDAAPEDTVEMQPGNKRKRSGSIGQSRVVREKNVEGGIDLDHTDDENEMEKGGGDRKVSLGHRGLPINKPSPVSLVPCDQRTLNRVAAAVDIRGMIAAGIEPSILLHLTSNSYSNSFSNPYHSRRRNRSPALILIQNQF